MRNALDAVGITVNKNTIPYDERPPAVPAVYVSAPSGHQPWHGPTEMRQISGFISRVLDNLGDEGWRGVRPRGAGADQSLPVPGVSG